MLAQLPPRRLSFGRALGAAAAALGVGLASAAAARLMGGRPLLRLLPLAAAPCLFPGGVLLGALKSGRLDVREEGVFIAPLSPAAARGGWRALGCAAAALYAGAVHAAAQPAPAPRYWLLLGAAGALAALAARAWLNEVAGAVAGAPPEDEAQTHPDE